MRSWDFSFGDEGVLGKVASDFTYDAKGKRDPFMPLVTSDGRLILEVEPGEKKEGNIKLEGIIYDSGGSSYVIINSIIVKAGEYVEGCQVLDIQPKKISILKDNKVIELKLREER